VIITRYFCRILTSFGRLRLSKPRKRCYRVIAGALPQLAAEMQLTLSQQDLVVSLMLVGAVFGAATGGLLCDRVGRWWTVMLTSAVFVLGGSMLYTAQNTAHLYAGRIVVSRILCNSNDRK
jgi:MFS family permease